MFPTEKKVRRDLLLRKANEKESTTAFSLAMQMPDGSDSLICLNPQNVPSLGDLGSCLRKLISWFVLSLPLQNEKSGYKWIVCDGPVDALWIENMNTLLDDNKMLCLANSERIKLTDNIKMLFEVQVGLFCLVSAVTTLSHVFPHFCHFLRRTLYAAISEATFSLDLWSTCGIFSGF